MKIRSNASVVSPIEVAEKSPPSKYPPGGIRPRAAARAGLLAAIGAAAALALGGVALAAGGMLYDTVPATLPSQPEPPQATGELMHSTQSGAPAVIDQNGLPEPRVVLADEAIDRGQPIVGEFLLADPVAKGTVTLDVLIYDSLGRELLRTTLPAQEPVAPKLQPINDVARAVEFSLTPPGVIAQRHYVRITAHTADGKTQSASASILYRRDGKWDDYLCNIWQQPAPKRIAALRNLYLNGSQYSGGAVDPPEAFGDADYRFYVEGTGNWVFSAYHRYFGDHRPNQADYLAIRKQYQSERKNLLLLQRDPCLSDHIVQQRIAVQFEQVAQRIRDFSPLFYSVADEAGIADQAANFDFCFSPACRTRFRDWLKMRYPTLDALNSEWDTKYTDWSQVLGELTDDVLARTDNNYSQWCDFKDFMDTVQVSAYDIAKTFMRRGDPRGRIGMGGAQGPTAVGGWDFWKLTRVMDEIEPYYIGNNEEIIHSFHPGCITDHTEFLSAKTIEATKRLTWYTFLLGDRGLWVWDDDKSLVNDAGQPSDVGKQMLPHWKELTGGIGMLRIASQRLYDPIAIYESQASLRVHWIQEVKPEGKTWLGRSSSSERRQNIFMRRRDSWLMLVEDNGYQARFIAPEETAGDLAPFDAKTGKGYQVLVLPQVLAMSQQEADAITKYVRDGGTVLADGVPGEFDEHGKKLDKPRLADLLAKGADVGKGHAILLDQDVQNYYELRLHPGITEQAPLQDYIGGLFRTALGGARVTPEVVGEDGKLPIGVMTVAWRDGGAEFIGLMRNPEFRINELGAQEYKSNKKFETPETVTLRSPEARAWYDVRDNKPLGVSKEITVIAPPFEPTFIMSFPAPAGDFHAAVDLKAMKIHLEPAADCPLQTAVYHLDFIAPDGSERLMYRENISVDPKGGDFELPLALNDPSGDWKLNIREVATGKEMSIPISWRK